MSLKYVAVGVVTLLFGALLGFQYKTAHAVRTEADNPETIAVDINRLYRITSKLRADVGELNAHKATLEQSSASADEAEQAVSATVSSYQTVAGETAVSGPGISLTINRQLEPTEMTDLLNILRGLGAEAIAVNNTRILISTPLDRSHLQHFGNPLTIQAIGNADQLVGGLSAKQGMLDQLARGNPDSLQLTKAVTLTLPAVSKQSPGTTNTHSS